MITSAAVGQFRAPAAVDGKPGDMVWVALRPEKVRITREQPAGPCVAGEVIEIGYLGDISIYKLRMHDGSVVKAAAANVGCRAERQIAADEEVWLSWPAESGIVLTR